jgi:hypothetical protein
MQIRNMKYDCINFLFYKVIKFILNILFDNFGSVFLNEKESCIDVLFI